MSGEYSCDEESTNIFYSIEESGKICNVSPSYDELLHDLEIMEMVKQNAHDSDFVASEIEYNINFSMKELMKIAEYYDITMSVDDTNVSNFKEDLISEIIMYEKNPDNLEMVFKRKKLWSYIKEIKEDKYLSKYLIFD
jgi:hypothetical protein